MADERPDDPTLPDAFYDALESYADEAGRTSPATTSPGQIAYETYFYEMENTAAAGSLRWQAQEGRVRDAWEAAAQAVLDAFLSSARLSPLPQEEEEDA